MQANINEILAARIYANITTPNTNSLRGDVREIVTTAGSFVGSLTTFAMQGTALGVPTIDIAGDLDADIDVATIKRPVNIGGAIKAGRTLMIREDLKEEAPLRIFASGGLVGRIIINADDAVQDGWQGTVKIGPGGTPITLSPAPNYTQLSSALGGGTVGLVPFNCHLQDCEPAYSGSNHPVLTSAPSTITLRHYGTVTWSGMPATVWFWDVESAKLVDVTGEWAVSNSPGTRDLVIYRYLNTPLPPGQYHIFPVRAGGNALRCTGIPAMNVVVHDYEYIFEYAPN